MTWKTAPAGLYTFDARTGRAVPILMVNEQGHGLLPGGATTKHIYLVGAPQGDPANTAEQSQARRDYQAAVREAERNGIKPCQHGEPRGPSFCALCRRQQGLR